MESKSLINIKESPNALLHLNEHYINVTSIKYGAELHELLSCNLNTPETPWCYKQAQSQMTYPNVNITV